MRAPAKRLKAPTGAKFRFCANRAKPPRTVRPMANGLAEFSCIDFSLSLIIHQTAPRLPDWVPTTTPERPPHDSPSGSIRTWHRSAGLNIEPPPEEYRSE